MSLVKGEKLSEERALYIALYKSNGTSTEKATRHRFNKGTLSPNKKEEILLESGFTKTTNSIWTYNPDTPEKPKWKEYRKNMKIKQPPKDAETDDNK